MPLYFPFFVFQAVPTIQLKLTVADEVEEEGEEDLRDTVLAERESVQHKKGLKEFRKGKEG